MDNLHAVDVQHSTSHIPGNVEGCQGAGRSAGPCLAWEVTTLEGCSHRALVAQLLNDMHLPHHNLPRRILTDENHNAKGIPDT